MKPTRIVCAIFSRRDGPKEKETGWSEEETRRMLKEAFGSVDPDATLLMRVERRVESGVADQVYLARRRSRVSLFWWAVWVYAAVVVAAAGIGLNIRMTIEDRTPLPSPSETSRGASVRSLDPGAGLHRDNDRSNPSVKLTGAPQ